MEQDQEEPEEEYTPAPRDTIKIKFTPQRFVRLGFDVSSVARQFYETEVQQFEFSLDSEIKMNWFAVLEGGFTDVAGQGEDFSYSGSGYFLRAGADYNFLKRLSAEENDIVFGGIRYSYSNLQHETPNYFISNPYWGSFEGAIEKSNFSQHWIEFAAGVKTGVFKNLYLGWTIKARVRLFQTKDEALIPYYIPGYGHGKRVAPVMIHYSILYKFGL